MVYRPAETTAPGKKKGLSEEAPSEEATSE